MADCVNQCLIFSESNDPRQNYLDYTLIRDMSKQKSGADHSRDQPPIRRKEYYDARQKNTKIKTKNRGVEFIRKSG